MNDELTQQAEKRIERQQEPPVQSPSRWRFSVTRLIVATALAPLPYWVFPTEQKSANIAFAVSSLAVAGVVLLVRARHLPRINLTLQIGVLVLICSSCCLPWFMNPIIFYVGAVLSALVAFLATEAIYPSRVVAGRAPKPLLARSVLLTGVTPFVLASLVLAPMNVVMPLKHTEDRLMFPTLLLVDVLMLTLFGWNVASWFSDEGATLEQRPDLGYRYEATTVLIPVAAIVLFLRAWGGQIE